MQVEAEKTSAEGSAVCARYQASINTILKNNGINGTFAGVEGMRDCLEEELKIREGLKKGSIKYKVQQAKVKDLKKAITLQQKLEKVRGVYGLTGKPYFQA